jgi:tetratricopeptide (TPR) repeat protein
MAAIAVKLTGVTESPMKGYDRKGMLSLKTFIVLLAFWAALAGNARAADPVLYQSSVDALYNLDFSTAESGFESLTRDYPANPEYWNAVASTIWLKIIYDQQKLNIESFSGSSLGTADSSEGINPADEKRLRDTVAIAMEKAQSILKSKPNDVNALYALGIANGTLASFEGTAKRSYRAAHGKARAARNLHERVLKLDPKFDDARLSIGAYDYVVGVIPWPVRMIIGLFGIRGNGKEAGLRSIETAAVRGKQVSTEAKMVLIVIYNREKRYEDALRLAGELHTKYPKNFLFELSKASIYGKMGNWNEAASVYQQVLAKASKGIDGYDRLRKEKVYYDLGNSNVHRLHFGEAVDAFDQVVRSQGSTANEKAGSHIWMGKIFDSSRNRAKAMEQYNAVLGLNCAEEFKDEARRYRRTPFVG